MEMENDLPNALRLVLLEERAALLSGRISDAGALSGRKQDLAERLAGLRVTDPDMLRQLHQEAQRNEALFAAALKGLQAARTRLEDIRRVVGHLDTYTSQGCRRDLIGKTATFERRA
ncbi:hypothetical protein [Tropicimonas sp.]|uniref:hypothetical protein n=1 Tax=Tropicimonas sp. TaxID=2067044 RepID=UPI003A8C86BD